MVGLGAASPLSTSMIKMFERSIWYNLLTVKAATINFGNIAFSLEIL